MSAVNPAASLGNAPITPPPGVSLETPEQEQLYRAALEFERFFVQNMLKGMQGSDALGGGGGDKEDQGAGTAGLSGYRDMAQDSMTQAVLDGGGLGLAATLYGQMADQLGIATDTDTDTGTTGDAAPASGAQDGGQA